MNKKAAMEMSVGTIVTIVLLMSVLVLGIFMIQKIFSGSNDAIDSINKEVEGEISKLFSEKGAKVAIYPSSREASIKKGDSPKGFAFSINNKDVESHTYSYRVQAVETFDFAQFCGSTTNLARANSYLLLPGRDNIRLAASSSMEIPELIKFKIPETAAACTIPYQILIDQESDPYQDVVVYLDIN